MQPTSEYLRPPNLARGRPTYGNSAAHTATHASTTVSGTQAASSGSHIPATISQLPSTSNIPSAPRRGGPRSRGGRGGRGGPPLSGSGTIPQSSRDQTINQESNHAPAPSRPQRGRHGGIRGNTNHSNVAGARAFGGSLTQPTSSLQASAAEFTPGRLKGVETPPFTGRDRHQAPQANQKKKRRPSKSTAPDLATRLHEDIELGRYECAICTAEVTRRSKVWSCHSCWTVFHLDCVKKWSANSEAAQAQQNANGEPAAQRTWRCPGCNLPQDVKPRSYHCWCGKEHEPRSITGLPPHSCGQTCGQHRVLPRKCPHPCELPCHAGPCPPCTHMGPTQLCYCGKETSTRRCVETNYDTGWSCRKICGESLPCGEHTCPRECHDGLCGACEVPLQARCYCGQVEKTILCADKDDDKSCKREHVDENDTRVSEEWTGLFKCANICKRPFDCGKHFCEEPCHPSTELQRRCPRSPDLIRRCPCSKTELSDITDKPRLTCEDPIPNCWKLCEKPLSCGHACEQACHTGDCAPCLRRVEIHCKCGRTSSSTICHQGTDEAPQCGRICHTTLNCGRHECGERCCSGERKAAARQSTRRRNRPLNAPRTVDEGFEAEHICTRPCGRTLKCGNHFCTELCHRGACGSCREAVFDEISCNCGRTVLQPPLPCGTKAPVCRYNCERPTSCGHPQVQHNCHTNEEECPKCPFLTEKQCLCGKRTLKNQRCWTTDARCGEICGRKLRCGSHTCRKTCHRKGECEDAGGSCMHACGKPKRACAHPCEDQCHAPYPCKEDKPCPHKALITCQCQHLKQEMRCNASSTSAGNTEKTLPCNDECTKLERNRKLALALNIDQESHTNDHVPYSAETLNMYQSIGQKWASDQEREFRVFAADEDERRLRFKPMPSTKRAFLHHLAEDFGMDSESMDPDPHRHVAVFKTPKFVSAPNNTLKDCIRIRRREGAFAAQQQLEAAQAKAQRSDQAQSWNGFLVTNPRFALTIDEVENETRAVAGPSSSTKIDFNIQFLPDGNVALKARQPSQKASPAVSDNEDDNTPASKILHNVLLSLKAPLFRAFSTYKFGTLQLARFDVNLNVLRRASDTISGGGWSQVAAKAAAPRRPIQQQERVSTNTFTVLGGGAKKKAESEKKKKVQKEEVVDDWADAVESMEALELPQERDADGTLLKGDAQADGTGDGINGNMGTAPADAASSGEHSNGITTSAVDEKQTNEPSISDDVD